MSCGITEEEIKEQIELKKSIEKVNLSKCKKCDNSTFVILQKKDVYCKLCFDNYCQHKFRSTLGKSKILKPKHKVLIGFSGGQSSAALVDLVFRSINNENASNRLMMIPYLFYIDETIILKSDKKSEYYNEEIKNLINKFPAQKFFSKIEMYYSKNKEFYSEDYSKLIDVEAQSEFIKTINSFQSWTAKEEYLRRIKINLMYRIAESEKIDFIFLGSNSTRLSIQLLTDVAQGKGNQIDSEICFVDNRNLEIPILKPMREFTSKEIIFWHVLNKNSFVEIEDLMTMKSSNSSIAKITEKFINFLQKDYPATTYTISKIGSKLKDQTNLNQTCLFCLSNVEKLGENLSAQLSLVTSNSLVPNKNNDVFDKSLCYGCNILVRESNRPKELLESIKSCQKT